MTTRRHVTDEEFREHYFGNPNDPQSMKRVRDNQRVMGAVFRRYSHLIDQDELERCGMEATWEALRYHDPRFKQRFTTSLHRFAKWVCQRETRKRHDRYAQLKVRLKGDLDVAVPENSVLEDIQHIRECMKQLPPEDQRLIEQRYFNEMTVDEMGQANGYSRETARHKSNKAMESLREVCHRDLSPV
jgi:RNA polymerase sigma factor (sigma-70 family)